MKSGTQLRWISARTIIIDIRFKPFTRIKFGPYTNNEVKTIYFIYFLSYNNVYGNFF